MELRMKRESEKERKDNEKKVGSIQLKLPKFMISKFEGTHLSWQRFWSQFENEIDQFEISQVSKFNYHKEMLKPKVRTNSDQFPFTADGFERATNFLKSKYDQGLTLLPTINNLKPQKINDFTKRLSHTCN